MAVEDHGLEAIRKSAEEVKPGDKSNYFIKSRVLFDSKGLDAFGRLRVSQPQTIFDAGFATNTLTKLFTQFTQTGGAIAHNANSTSVDFSTNTTQGSKAVLQTSRFFNYHPGKSQLLLVTGNMHGKQSGIRKRIGLFDDKNGVFFELNGQLANCVFRSSVSGSVVDTSAEQSTWNIDKLDGTGQSGITLDWTKQQILFLDFQWLGSGAIRFGTIIGGQVIYAHQFNNANVLDSPWAQFSIWPIRAEMENTGTPTSNGAGTLTCMSVISEGGWNPQGLLATANTSSTPRALSTGQTLPVISIRKQSASVKIPIIPIDFTLLSDTADTYLVRIVKNGTLTAPSWVSTGQVSEYDVSASAITGGETIYSRYLSSQVGSVGAVNIESLREVLNTVLGASFNGGTDAYASEMFSVVVTTLSGAASLFGSINFKELV